VEINQPKQKSRVASQVKKTNRKRKTVAANIIPNHKKKTKAVTVSVAILLVIAPIFVSILQFHSTLHLSLNLFQ
jgi:hypothetical protein